MRSDARRRATQSHIVGDHARDSADQAARAAGAGLIVGTNPSGRTELELPRFLHHFPGRDRDFGTTVDGSVCETALPDGLAEVKVVLHSSNALTRAFDVDFNPLFGYGGSGGVNPPTLGDALAQIKLSNTAPGAPLPDISQVLFCPERGQALETFSMRARASGPLREAFGVPEGSPGWLEVTQNGLIGTAAHVNPHSRLAVDAFPAEHVIIRATGR